MKLEEKRRRRGGSAIQHASEKTKLEEKSPLLCLIALGQKRKQTPTKPKTQRFFFFFVETVTSSHFPVEKKTKKTQPPFWKNRSPNGGKCHSHPLPLV
jgi:hypothetical protein